MKPGQGLWIIFFLSLWTLAAAQAAEPGVAITQKRVSELDEKALVAKKSAVHSLADIVRRNANKPEEPALLLRLAEMNEDIAAIQFRLAYSKAPTHSQADLSGYWAYMKVALEPLNRLITVYPRSNLIPRAYYLRSKALGETGQTALALADLKKLVETWPQSKDAPVANMDLLRLLMQQKDYTIAIQYINRYGFRPEDKYYHAVLEKMSWCQFYLGVIPEALRYTQVELKTVKGVDRDKALSNYALFYSTGVERKTPGVTAEAALDQFKSVASGKDFASLTVSYAYLLRSKGLDQNLDALKTAVIAQSVPDSFKSDILLITLENQYNRRHYGDMKQSAEQEIALFTASKAIREDSRRVAKIKNSLNEIIPGLQKLLTEHQVEKNPDVSSTLRLCYQFLLETGNRNPLEQSRIHFNMAEVSLELKEYDAAAEHYRWAVKHLDRDKKDEQELYLLSSLKALDARYAMLKEKGWTPQSLAAKPFSTPKKDVPKPVLEWVDWIDEFPKEFFVSKKVDVHAFEANRILYSYDQIEKATKRMNEFALAHPTSTFAVSAASLVLDTYIASAKWEDAYELTQKYSAVKEWNALSFHGRVAELSADIYCKVIDGQYRDKKYEQAIKNAESFVAANPQSKRQGDMLEIAANAALANGNRVKAAELFKRLLNAGVRKPEVTALAHMTQGAIAEEKYDFSEAVKNFREAIVAGAPFNEEMRTKILLLSWLTGEAAELDATLGNQKICPRETVPATCTQYAKRFEETYGLPVSYFGSSNSAPIARIAQREKLTVRDRMEILASVPGEWSKLDAVERAAILPVLLDRVPGSFKTIREQIRKSSPLRLEGNAIAKRKRLIDLSQDTVEKLAALSLHGVQLGLIRENAALYEEAAQDVLAIAPPKGLKGDPLKEFKQALTEGSSAFAQRAQELRKAEKDLLAQRGGDVKPETAKQWSEIFLSKGDPGSSAKDWFPALKAGLAKQNWQLSAFLIERMPDADTHKPYLRAALLSRSGAVPEALAQVSVLPSQIESQLPPPAPVAQPAAAQQLGDVPPAPGGRVPASANTPQKGASDEKK